MGFFSFFYSIYVSDRALATYGCQIPMALSDSQKTCILTIRLICSFFSMLGTLFVISSSLYFKQFKGMSSRLILYLMTASAGTSIVNIFSLGATKLLNCFNQVLQDLVPIQRKIHYVLRKELCFNFSSK